MTEMKLSERNERLILGIDPGFGRMGYAVVAAAGNESAFARLRCDHDADRTGLSAAVAVDL